MEDTRSVTRIVPDTFMVFRQCSKRDFLTYGMTFVTLRKSFTVEFYSEVQSMTSSLIPYILFYTGVYVMVDQLLSSESLPLYTGRGLLTNDVFVFYTVVIFPVSYCFSLRVFLPSLFILQWRYFTGPVFSSD